MNAKIAKLLLIIVLLNYTIKKVAPIPNSGDSPDFNENDDDDDSDYEDDDMSDEYDNTLSDNYGDDPENNIKLILNDKRIRENSETTTISPETTQIEKEARNPTYPVTNSTTTYYYGGTTFIVTTLLIFICLVFIVYEIITLKRKMNLIRGIDPPQNTASMRVLLENSAL